VAERVTDTGIAVVVGGASGIGAASALALGVSGRYGAVFIVDVKNPQVPPDRMLTADLEREAERSRVIDELLQSPDRISAFVYSAGIAQGVGTGEEAWPAWRRILEIDLIAPAHILCAMHDRFFADGTAVVTVDSTAADIGSRGDPPYAAAKSGLRLLTRSLASRTKGSGARYNGVSPGPIDTPLSARLAHDMGVEVQAFADRTIAGRMGKPAEVAAAVNFLCSPEASYVNGAVMTVDGGYLAG
jgi:NAD(P)-dependent dehydrogenase (short-subunit alcohol dehydrogenase family)